MSEPIKIGLALGGGGARGLSHVGILQVFEDAEIPLHAVAGVSIGAVVGGLYAADPRAASLEEKLRATEANPTHQRACRQLALGMETFCGKGIFSRGYYATKALYLLLRFAFRGSLYPSALQETLLGAILPETNIEDLPLLFGALTLDANTADVHEHTTGNLRDVVLASSAIPCIFPLRTLGGKLLGDPTAANAVPVQLMRQTLGCDLVIAVDVGSELPSVGDLSRGHRMALRLTAILSERLNRVELAGADIVIRPDLDMVPWTDFSHLDTPIAQGRAAAEAALPQIRAAIAKHNTSA